MTSRKRPREQLTAKQIQAIQLVLQGRNWREIAKTVGVSEKCLWEWRQQSLFHSTLTVMAEIAIQETATLFSTYISTGFAKIYEIATTKDPYMDKRLVYDAAKSLVELPLAHIKTLKILEHNRKEMEWENNVIELNLETKATA